MEEKEKQVGIKNVDGKDKLREKRLGEEGRTM
jgi:hypothetical protein